MYEKGTKRGAARSRDVCYVFKHRRRAIRAGGQAAVCATVCRPSRCSIRLAPTSLPPPAAPVLSSRLTCLEGVDLYLNHRPKKKTNRYEIDRTVA